MDLKNEIAGYFHYKDDLYFKRNKDHSVTIKKLAITYGMGEAAYNGVIFEVTIDENGWASIIASVSKAGESNGRFYDALEWHNGEYD